MLRWLLLLLSIVISSLYLALEIFVLLYAINNRHYAYYFGLFGLAVVIMLLVETQFNRRSPVTGNFPKASRIGLRIMAWVGVVLGTAMVGVNWWFAYS